MMIAGEDTTRIETILQKPPDIRASEERKKLSFFNRSMYRMFVNIRNVLTDNHCRGMSVAELKRKINMIQIQEYFSYTEAEINYCLSFVEQYIKIVR